MEFGNENFLRRLERPPNIKNLSFISICQIILMLLLGCWAGFKIYQIIGKTNLFAIFQIIIYTSLTLGFLLTFYGLFTEKNASMKTGFLFFLFGCILLIIKAIYEVFSEYKFQAFIEIITALILVFMIMKQIQHI